MTFWKGALMTFLVVVVSIAVAKALGKYFPATRNIPFVGGVFQ